MDLSRLKLKGNSNYKLEVRNADNPLVLKYSHERDERLLKSALKQSFLQDNGEPEHTSSHRNTKKVRIVDKNDEKIIHKKHIKQRRTRKHRT